MISYEQAVAGFTRYVYSEMLPHMTGIKSVALGAYTALAAKNAAQAIRSAAANPAVAITGAITQDGLDLDLLYNAVNERMSDSVQLDIPFIGVFTVGRADIDKLCNYMRGAL